MILVYNKLKCVQIETVSGSKRGRKEWIWEEVVVVLARPSHSIHFLMVGILCNYFISHLSSFQKLQKKISHLQLESVYIDLKCSNRGNNFIKNIFVVNY